MSECIVERIEDQEKCEHYEKSSHRNCCMHFAFEKFCDSLKAQQDASKSLQEKNQETINELKDSEVGKTS